MRELTAADKRRQYGIGGRCSEALELKQYFVSFGKSPQQTYAHCFVLLLCGFAKLPEYRGDAELPWRYGAV